MTARTSINERIATDMKKTQKAHRKLELSKQTLTNLGHVTGGTVAIPPRFKYSGQYTCPTYTVGCPDPSDPCLTSFC